MTEVDSSKQFGRGLFSSITMTLFQERVVVSKKAIIRVEDGIEEDTVGDLQNEYRILCQLEHPNIISPVLRSSSLGGKREFLMPLYSMDLNQYIIAKNMPSSQFIMGVMLQLSSALGYMHELGYVHGDVKPANVLCDPDEGLVVLADFGFATKETPDDAYHRFSGPDDYSRGSLLWMAPERIHHPRLIRTSSDIWCWALVGYFLFAREEPWNNYLEKKKFMADMSDQRLVSQLKKAEDCPEMVWELFRSCWVYAFASRPTAKACHTTIETIQSY